MKRVVSSRHPKRLFLTRILGGSLGLVVALYVLVSLQSSAGTRREPWVAAAVAVVLVWVVLVVKDLLTWRDLKQVAVDEHFVYVSGYADAQEIAIPLSDIVRVSQKRGRTLRTVTMQLRAPSECGDRIRFQPKIDQWGWAFTEDAIVRELRALADPRRRG